MIIVVVNLNECFNYFFPSIKIQYCAKEKTKVNERRLKKWDLETRFGNKWNGIH